DEGSSGGTGANDGTSNTDPGSSASTSTPSGTDGGTGPSSGSGNTGGGATTSTPNPNPHAPEATIVLVHGSGGFKKILGVDYFFQVPGAWRAQGAKVYVAELSSMNSIEERANELKSQLDRIDGPLVIVAHSQGGLDARYLITQLGYASRTRALITIGTPHHGTQVADIIFGILPGSVAHATDVVLNVVGWSLAGTEEMTTKAMARFNAQIPDAPGVTYWSWSGRATPFGIGSGNGWLDPSLLTSWLMLNANHIESDGLIPEASAHWGQFQGTLTACHLGEVGQPLGATPDFDHAKFYKTLLQRLHDQGW
ncbi:MAG: hypothetical protein JST92_02700, partial [Deltaproteobacteria bacterium]|nr:hypothetical protein [Deltaproteobacteria bacterium]